MASPFRQDRQNHKVAGLILVYGMALASIVMADGDVPGPGDHEFTFSSRHGERRYLVHAPSGYDAKVATPVVLAIHGGGGNADGMPDVTGLNEISERKGFLVVYPEGTGPRFDNGKVAGAWNTGSCCGSAMEEGVDDVAYFSELLDRLQVDFHVDPRRVYATGISNGSQMSFRLACDLAGRIAAVAPTGSPGTHATCTPDRPVPVMYFHGSADPCAPYQGGEECGGCLHEFLLGLCDLSQDPDACRQDLGEPVHFTCEPVEEYLLAWRERNGCPPESTETFQNGKATCVTWGPCEEDAEVTLCTVEDMGHTWPGGTNGPLCTSGQTPGLCSSYEEIVGPVSNDIVASEAMWDFFERHSIPGPAQDEENSAGSGCSTWVSGRCPFWWVFAAIWPVLRLTWKKNVD